MLPPVPANPEAWQQPDAHGEHRDRAPPSFRNPAWHNP
jgi:hypothetical protein